MAGPDVHMTPPQTPNSGGLSVDPIKGESSLDLSVVLPTYNEAKNIAAALEQLTSHLDAVTGLRYEIIVVDDDSPDRTWERALEFSEKSRKVRVIRRQNERGLSTAVIRGWQAARGRVLGVMDADLQHPPEIAAKLWSEMARGADLGVASRHIEGAGVSDWSMSRRVVSRFAQVIGLVLLPEVTARVSDPMSGYFMISRACVERRELNPLGYKILIEVLGRGQVRWISEVPYTFRERVEGASKISNKIYWQYIRHLIRIRMYLLQTSSLVRFCIVGLSGVVIDMSLLYLLSDPRTLHWGLTSSKIVAAETALFNNFVWNDLWTFRRISIRQNKIVQRAKRFLKFNALCSVGLALNVIILNVEFNLFHVNRYLANLIAIMIATGWNYGANVKLNWRIAEVD